MATSHQGFCDDYFLLNPEKATLFDLFSLLFSPQLEKRGFIDCPGSKHQSFLLRWPIFVSIVLQILFIWVKKPMAFMGDAIEMWLNLLSANGGLFRLLLNLPTGKTEWPKRTSAKFTSMIGNTDTRLELDETIKPADQKYKASLSMMASKLSYENEAFIETKVTQLWKGVNHIFKIDPCVNQAASNVKITSILRNVFDFGTEYRGGLPSTQAFILQDTQANPNLYVVAFRGTSPFDADDWRTDADFSWCKIKAMDKARTHSGFMQALGLQKNNGWPKEIQQHRDGQRQFAYYAIRQKLREILKENEDAKFIVTGHSLGGALAILFAAVLMLHDEELLLEKLDGVFTFGQPRVGDENFGEYMKEKMKKFDVKYLRYVYNNDLVPRVPYDDKMTLFKHFGPCLFFNSFYTGEVLPEQPNKNYFSLLWVIPKMVNAVWELIRGIILPYMYGPDYKEGWVLRMLRVIGLLVPGVSAHSPQDYVNSTRLGTLSDVELHKHQLKID
ncbi:Lipase, class 3 [Gossypium australe]|uniref:Lipase, class 3 n=1 Tax=Gossypium australe TaxID=47621 RepID=A0A5B6U6Z8_9ROSI|nr:Lipase, class 3 [Gossypium australe]